MMRTKSSKEVKGRSWKICPALSGRMWIISSSFSSEAEFTSTCPALQPCGGGNGVAVGKGVAVGGGSGVAVGRGVAVGWRVGVGLGGAGVAVGKGGAVGGGGKGVGVGAKPGADRSKGVGGSGSSAEGRFGFSGSLPGILGPETPGPDTPAFCDGSVPRISTTGGGGVEAGTPLGDAAKLVKPGVGAAAGRQLATVTATIRAVHSPRIRKFLRPMPNRCNTAAEAPTTKAGKPT